MGMHIEQGVTSTLPSGTSTIGGTFTAPYSTITSGRKTVTTPGTAVTLGASTAIKAIIVTTLQTNGDIVAVGGSTVLAAEGTRNGTPLYPGQSVVMYINDLASVYIDAVVAGEGVAFNYFT